MQALDAGYSPSTQFGHILDWGVNFIKREPETASVRQNGLLDVGLLQYRQKILSKETHVASKGGMTIERQQG
jgi:hypothetical protein